MTQEEKQLLLKDLCARINSERWMSMEDYPGEEWKVLDGHENRYMVSNIGRVKTKKFTYTIHGKEKVKPEHIIKDKIDTNQFFHPLYLMRYGRNKNECKTIINSFNTLA